MRIKSAVAVAVLAAVLALPAVAGAADYIDRASWEGAMNSWIDVTIPSGYGVGDIIDAGTPIQITSDLYLTFTCPATVADATILSAGWPAGSDIGGKVLVFDYATLSGDPLAGTAYVDGYWHPWADVKAWAVDWEGLGNGAGHQFWGWGNAGPYGGFGMDSTGGDIVMGRMSLGDPKPDPTPLPGSLLLLGSGLAGLLGFKKKRG